MNLPDDRLSSVELKGAILPHPLTVTPDTTVREAISLMGTYTQCNTHRQAENSVRLEARASCVLIVVEQVGVVGILTDRDVVRLSAQQQPLDRLSVGEVMTQPVITHRESELTDLFSTIELLKRHRIRHLPIVDDDDRLIGTVTHESLRQQTHPIDLLRLRSAAEVMTARVLTAEPDSSMLEIARLMAEHRVSSVAIAVPGGIAEAPFQRAVGLLTERDLVQFQALGLSLTETTARQVMSSLVFTVGPQESLWTVQQMMEQHSIGRVVVAGEQGELLGIITQTSMLKAFNPLEIYTLAEVLEKKVTRLEAERISLLDIRAAELERQVTERTQMIQMQGERDRLMAELTSQILASLDVQVILDTTVQQVRKILGCDRVNIWRFEAEWVSEVVAESTDSDLSLLGERIHDTCFAQSQAEIYRQGHIRTISDIYTTEMSDCHCEMLIRLQTRAKILVPLLCGDQLWGLLNVTEIQPRNWQPAEVEFLRSLSMQLAIALQQASTHEQLQSQLQERQQAERQLRRSTERLHEAQRIAHIGNWELDLQHNTLFWSEEVFRIFEIDPQQFDASYEGFLDLVHPDDRTLVNEAYRNHLCDRQAYSLVHRLQMPDGRIKYVQEQCETTHSADGTPLRSRGTVQDITQQQEAEIRRDRAEAALRQLIEGTAAFTGEEFFPALVRHIAEALGVRYASVSQALPEGFQVLAFFADGELLPPPRLPYESVPCCTQALNIGNCCHPENIRSLYPDNALFTDLRVESYLGVGLRNAAGDPIGSLCIFHDAPLATPDWAQTLLTIFAARAGAELERLITAQALEQLNADLEARVADRTAELAEGKAFLQDFLDNANDLIQIVNVNTGRFEFVNRAWRKTLGYTATEVEQLTVFDVLAPNCIPHCQTVMEQMQAGTLTHLEGVELTFVHRSGQLVLVEGSINCRWGVSANGRSQTLSTRAIFRDVTAKKTAEQELQRREARYRALMAGASDAILLVNPQGYLMEANQKAADLLGYERYELMGMHITQLHPPESLPRVIAALEDLTEQKQLQILDLEFLSRDGQRVPVDVTGSVIEVGGETIIQAIFHDIRERQRAQQALRESEIRFRRVFESNVVGMMFADFSGCISDANDRFLEMLGYTRQELESDGGLNWIELTPPEYQAQDQAAIAQLQDNDFIPPREKAYRHKDGHLVPVLIGVAMLSRSEESCVGVVVDISDRKRYETALQESQQFLQTILDTVPISVFWKDRASHYLGANQRFLQDASLSAISELVGKTDLDLPWGTTEAEDYRADDRAVMDSGEAKLSIIETQYQQDGKTIWLETNKLPLRNLVGEVIGVLGTYQDISDRKQTEETMRQQAQRETLLREIAQRIRESLDLQTIFNTACEEIRACLRADRVGIFKFYPDSGYDDGEFVAEAVVNGFPSVVALRVHDHCFGENYSNLYAQGRCYVADDIYDNSLSHCHTDILAQFQVQANLVMPLLYNHKLWGLLCIHQCDAPRHWQQSEIELGQQLANQLAIAIQQAILYEQLQTELQERHRAETQIIQQLRQQTALELILQQIRQSLDLPEILEIATQQVQELLHSDRTIVFQVSHDGGSRIIEEAVAPDLPRLKAMHWDDETWSQDILECYWQGQPRIVPDVMDDIWTDCLVEYSRAGQIQSKMVAPILQELRDSEAHRWVSPKGNNKLWGVLVVHACRTRRVWHPNEAQLLQQIANQLAIAIQQSHLFEQLQQELSERQQTQQQLTQRNKELIRATRLKDEFLANMSHELRTPLNAILGMTEGLQEEVFGKIAEAQLKALQTVEQSASHLLALINEILDLAKIDAGQVELECGPTAIALLCQSSLAFVKQQALKKQIQLSVNFPLNLPDIVLDERRIRQVLINLLNNAVKFTPAGGRVTLEVTLPQATDQEKANPYLRLAVRDTGIGISPENAQKLFQPFVQIDSALNRQYQGTGLGLALTKRIVELHDGQVSLTSEVGVGSCFAIDLPYQASAILPQLTNAEAEFSAKDGEESSVQNAAPLLLLAEDNEANISTISSYLRAKGYRIELAKNGQEAISQAIALSPDLILMDIQMPGMDGLEAMQRIREIPQLAATPIIALTALAMESDRDRCLAAGANEYLSKPVKLKQLTITIQEVLNS